MRDNASMDKITAMEKKAGMSSFVVEAKNDYYLTQSVIRARNANAALNKFARIYPFRTGARIVSKLD
jgi:hypothetical protein